MEQIAPIEKIKHPENVKHSENVKQPETIKHPGDATHLAQREASAGMDEDEWLSMDQAAERLASSRRVVTRWAQSGKLGEVRPGQIGRGKGMRVRARAVEARIAERAEQLQRRLAQEADRKARLERANRSGATIMVSKRNLNWMLDLARTLSDMADETIKVDGSSMTDTKDARKVFEGIAAIQVSLRRIRDRSYQDETGEEGGEG